MADGAEEGISLSLEDCRVLFPRLKKTEDTLTEAERNILLRLEKYLYTGLSIRDVEDLLRNAPVANPDSSLSLRFQERGNP